MRDCSTHPLAIWLETNAITVTELARQIGVSYTSIYNVMRNKAVSESMALKISEFTGLSFDELQVLVGTGEKHYVKHAAMSRMEAYMREGHHTPEVGIHALLICVLSGKFLP